MGGKRVWKIREKRRRKAWKSKEAKEKYWKEVDNQGLDEEEEEEGEKEEEQEKEVVKREEVKERGERSKIGLGRSREGG